MPVKQISPEQQQLNDLRFRIRHSAAHIMAEAVLDLFPEAKFAVGPPTDDGFYYDFAVGRPFTPEDLGSIEDRMRETIASGACFERTELPRAAAKERFAGQPFKLEIIDGIPDDEAVTTYAHAAFVDLCRGPHVDSAGEVAAFKLTSVAGAYWRGDEHNEMLQRIYGTAWESEDALIAHLNRLEEAAKRDHRKLGQELGLFFFDPIAPASPFFLPKGATLNNTLVGYVRGLYQRYGYQEVITPQVFDSELWKRSGHYDNYKEHMYFTYVDDREFGVKPMNCPAAAMLYAAQLHSYRDLPVRYADFGRLHRFERSGVTHGLTRVRTFSQDDAHIFCAPWQVESEIVKFIAMVRETYDVFGFEDVRVALSLRPEKRIGSDELWDAAERALASALDIQGLEYEPVPNEGAFYGPKIDFFVADAIGREWQLSTVQLDYNLPERFDLEFVDDEGARQAAGRDPPRNVGESRTVPGCDDRALRRRVPHVARADPGRDYPHRRPSRRIRGARSRRARVRGPTRPRRRPQRAHEREDSRRPAPEGAVHARRGRQGGGGQRRRRPPSLWRGLGAAASPRHRVTYEGRLAVPPPLWPPPPKPPPSFPCPDTGIHAPCARTAHYDEAPRHSPLPPTPPPPYHACRTPPEITWRWRAGSAPRFTSKCRKMSQNVARFHTPTRRMAHFTSKKPHVFCRNPAIWAHFRSIFGMRAVRCAQPAHAHAGHQRKGAQMANSPQRGLRLGAQSDEHGVAGLVADGREQMAAACRVLEQNDVSRANDAAFAVGELDLHMAGDEDDEPAFRRVVHHVLAARGLGVEADVARGLDHRTGEPAAEVGVELQLDVFEMGEVVVAGVDAGDPHSCLLRRLALADAHTIDSRQLSGPAVWIRTGRGQT